MIKDYWTKASSNYSDLIDEELQKSYKDKWMDFILDEIKDLEGPLEILDIGTGPGFFPLILSSQDRHLTGIDLTESMIEEAKKKLQAFHVDADLLVMDCQETSFPDQKFDCIICRNLVWTLPDPEKAYKEWFRILKPGGRLLIFDGSCYIHHFDPSAKERYQALKDYVKKTYDLDVYDYGDKEKNPDDYELMKTTFLSDKFRPEWDEKTLTSIGFKIDRVLEDYLDFLVGKEERLAKGDISPVFFIKASK